MMLFSKDTEEVSRIADSLVKCGCCARCTLRYLGLKDTYSYKKTIEVNELSEPIHGILILIVLFLCIRGSRGGSGGPDPPHEKSQKYRVS